MTLMEVILAIVLLAIISMAAFAGFQYAFYTLSSADQFSESAYENQSEFENSLSLARQLAKDEDAVSVAAIAIVNGTTSDEVISFSWDTTNFDASAEDLNDFDSIGVTIEDHSVGGDYLDKTIYTFIPLYTEIP